MADAALHVVTETDRPVLRGDSQSGQVDNHRVSPAVDPHRTTGVGHHREPRQSRLFGVLSLERLGRGLDPDRPRFAHQPQRSGGFGRQLGLALAETARRWAASGNSCTITASAMHRAMNSSGDSSTLRVGSGIFILSSSVS